MRTGTLVNRLILSLTFLFLSIIFNGIAGQTLSLNDIPDQIIEQGQSFSTISLDDYINVPSNQLHEIQWTATGANELSVNIDNGRKASLMPLSESWTGSETITFNATDSDMNTGSDAATFTINQNINAVPVMGDIPGQELEEGSSFQPVNLDDYVTDDDHSKDQLTWSASGNSALSVNINPNTHTALIEVPDENWNGSETIVFKATDPEEASSEDEAVFTLTPVNDPPVIGNIPDQTIQSGESFNTIALDNYVTDVDNSDAEMVWAITGNTDLSPAIDGSRIATINKPSNWNGSEELNFTVKDPADASASDAALFTAQNINAVPVVGDIPGQELEEGSSFQPVNLDDFVTDDDHSKDQLTWTASGNSALSVNINPNTHTALIEVPDDNWNGSETIVFKATDPEAASSEDAAVFTLTPVNDPPVIGNIPDQTIQSGESFNTIALDNYVTDVDNSDAEMVWAITGNTELSPSIDDSRIATINKPSNWNGSEELTFTVNDPADASASDNATFALPAAAPTDISLSPASVAENQPVSTLVGALTTEDADVGETFTYTLVSGPGSGDNTSFSIAGSNVVTQQTFDFEADASFSIRIRSTTDGDGLFIEKAFTVAITNANEAPTNITLSNNTIAEHLPANTVVGDLSTTDPDAGDSFTYTLVSGTGSEDNTSFNISGNSLSATASLNFETKSSYTVRIRSTDAGNEFTEKAFTITVTNTNEPPTDITLSNNTIAEHLPANTVVGILSTADLDAGDSFTYTLVIGTGSTDNSSFNISGNQLRATASLNFETKSSYSVRIRSTDMANAFIEKSFTITLTNSNETPTDIILSNNIVPDHQPVNTVVGTLSTTDLDVGDTYTYTLVSGTGSLDNSSFNIAGNQLRTSAVFDYSTQSSYSIRIRTTDAGSAFFEKSFLITVTNSNNIPTNITLSSSSIAENQPANSVVGNLSATDPDAGDTFVFTLAPGTGSTDNGNFNILGTQLRANLPLNYELKSSYNIRIRVTDVFNGIFEKAFVITVLNVNEPPLVSSANYTLDGKIGVLHTGSFTGYSDPEGDAPGIHTYKWYTSPNSSGDPATPISGATGISYTPVMSDGGKYLSFEVTPVDIFGAVGTPVRSSFRRVNDAPNATNAQVYAPVALPGQTIRGRFTYSDAENNPRGNAIYQWYRKNTNSVNYSSPGTPIGTDSTYVLKNLDAGRYIWFKVKPVATSGSTPGDSTWSNIIGPIGSFSAGISGTAGFCTGLSMPITLTITGGVAPYTAVLTRSGSTSNKDTTIAGITASPYIIQVKIAGSYVLKSLIDASTPTPDNAIVTPDAVVLTTFPKPSAVLSGGAPVCNDGTSKSDVTLNLSGAAPWTFTIRRGSAAGDTTFSGITSDPFIFDTRIVNSPTTIRLTAISDAHCTGDTTGSGTLRITYLPSPNASISGQDSICPGGTGDLRVTLGGTSGPWSITYLRDGANPTIVNNITTSPYTLHVQGTGTYTLSRVAQVPGCTGKVSGTGRMVSHTVPTASLSGSSTFCEYTTGNLNVNLTGNAPWKFSYRLNSETPVEVLNVYSSPKTVSINKAGTYTLYEMNDKNCIGTTSGSAVITVTPAPSVTLSGLASAYDKDYLDMVPITGTPSGGTFTGPDYSIFNSLNSWYFLPRYAPVGTHHIVYQYMDGTTECFGYDTATVRVLEAEAIIEFPEDRVKYCRNEVPFTVTGANVADNIGTFTISGGEGLVDNHDNTATIDPSQLSVKDYTITYTYFDGTTLNVNNTIEVGNPPVADFQWKTECFEEQQEIQFNETSYSTFGNITAYHWKVYTSTGFDTASTPEISHTFPQPGNHIIELQVETSYGCSGIVAKVFGLRPTINPKDDGFLTENFDNGPLSWQSATPPTPTTNSWTLGTPDDPTGINGAHSGEFSWYTNIPDSDAPREQSWVSSPCYDFTGMERPMVKMFIWRDFNGRRDGTVLQATTDSAKTWNNIGKLDDGQNWFNEYSILGNPGNQSIGWSDIQDGRWVEARHSLDELKNKTRVQFRIAYGSDGTVQNTDGFAFDDFWIGERNRMVLIEHFTNASDAASQDADSIVNHIVNEDSLNAMDLQYHTSFPGDDPFNEQEPYAPSARLLYYGISDVPYAILNGGYKSGYRYDYSTDDEPDANGIHLESLNDAKFDIQFSGSGFLDNTVTFDVVIFSRQNLLPHEYTLHAGVFERRVAATGINGETIYENVVRALLPDPAGITILDAWTAGVPHRQSYTWEIPNGYNRDQLMAFAFMQDESTHEIYQVNKVKIGYSTELPDLLPETSRNKFIVFPNPASDQAFIRFDKPVKGDIKIEMFNNLGSLVYTGMISRTDTDTEINTEKYPDGLYIIRATAGSELLGVMKLNITR